ncbi:Ribonuclease P protein component 1 [Methanobacterium paludis]|uniref:Ribonuclease P protein component 1 n=2 Tax=Methanobacterium paludis (strain DSM 25820 / JCM 18151 / SWAN1) TaxID=868131 RepID=F6D7K9_METPW|nr:Ribonuclease P protein component 1 [Methanobacterium paludis]
MSIVRSFWIKIMITPQNIFRHELIGLPVKVNESSHEGFIGIHGKVVDETKNTITVDVDGTEKQVPKNVATFHFKLPDGTVVEIDGRIIVARPEDRIKKKFRKYW